MMKRIAENNYFDVHHHERAKHGIYNLGLNENLSQNNFSVGLHPKDISEDFERDLEKIQEISKNLHCVAMGECGLDALVNVDEQLQEKIFEAQILWANEIQKPVIVHCVRRFSQLLKFQKIAKIPMIIHGFNKKKSIADELLKKGFYLSFGKSILYNEASQDVVKNIPLDKIFLETDAENNISVEEIYHQLAKIKSIELKEVQEQIEENIKQVFEIKL